MFGINKKKKLLKNGAVVDKPVPKEPRAQDDIQKEYAHFCTQAGDKQYRVDVLKAEIKQINNHLFTLNQESVKRQELDKDAPKAEVEASDVVAPI